MLNVQEIVVLFPTIVAPSKATQNGVKLSADQVSFDAIHSTLHFSYVKLAIAETFKLKWN